MTALGFFLQFQVETENLESSITAQISSKHSSSRAGSFQAKIPRWGQKWPKCCGLNRPIRAGSEEINGIKSKFLFVSC